MDETDGTGGFEGGPHARGTRGERRDGLETWRGLRGSLVAMRAAHRRTPDVALGRAVRLLVYRHMRDERRIALTRFYELYVAYERMLSAAGATRDGAWGPILDETLDAVVSALDRAAVFAGDAPAGLRVVASRPPWPAGRPPEDRRPPRP